MLFQITCKYTLDEQNYLKTYLLKKTGENRYNNN